MTLGLETIELRDAMMIGFRDTVFLYQLNDCGLLKGSSSIMGLIMGNNSSIRGFKTGYPRPKLKLNCRYYSEFSLGYGIYCGFYRPIYNFFGQCSPFLRL